MADTSPFRFPLQEFLGFEMDGDGAGTATAHVQLGPQHLNPYGMVHGAVLFALVDTVMGKATTSVLDEGVHCASIEVSLRFIRPASSGTLRTEATVVRRGRAIVHLEGRVHDAEDRLVATAAGTFAVLG